MRRFVIDHSSVKGTDGIDFEVDDDATEDEINQTAFDMVCERVDYRLTEVTDRPPKDEA